MSALTGDKTAAGEANEGPRREKVSEESQLSGETSVCVCVCLFNFLLCQRLIVQHSTGSVKPLLEFSKRWLPRT